MALKISEGYGWTTFCPSGWTKKLQYCTMKINELKKTRKVDALAYTGSSGAAAAYVLGVALNLPVVYVRKEGEPSHGSKVESNATKSIKNYLIIDDFICSGTTVKNIVSGIANYAKETRVKEPTCVGVFLYQDDTNRKSVAISVNSKKRTLTIFK